MLDLSFYCLQFKYHNICRREPTNHQKSKNLKSGGFWVWVVCFSGDFFASNSVVYRKNSFQTVGYCRQRTVSVRSPCSIPATSSVLFHTLSSHFRTEEPCQDPAVSCLSQLYNTQSRRTSPTTQTANCVCANISPIKIF